MIKKFGKFCLLSLLLSGSLLNAEESKKTSVYEQYQDWQFHPVTVKDENSDSNVRNQMDFTVPIHGPWLLNPGKDSITINWITRIPCAAGLQYREKGTEEFTTLWTVRYGQIDYTKDLHTYHLSGLKPNTEYEYRFLSNCDSYFTPYHGTLCTGREIYSFKTLEPEKKNYKVFLTSDIHGTFRLTLDPLVKATNAMECDLFFFLGDNVEDNVTDIRYHTTFGFLDDVGRYWGKSKPTVYLRGNHDLSGRQTYQYGDYFPRPDGKTYQAFRQGPVLYIALDTLWMSGVKVQNEQYQKYLQEQADWIRALRKTDDWKKSKFRVVMAHVPIVGSAPNYFDSIVKALDEGTGKKDKIHVFLAGHEHLYYRINSQSNSIYLPPEKPGQVRNLPNYLKGKQFNPKPYTMVSLNMCEGMIMDVSPEKLTFKSHKWNNVKGGLADAFEIYPDGSIKELNVFEELRK